MKKTGFTLIELSMVLVIVGLLVGGVILGRDLIRAAEIRASITQVEKYNLAANVFRTKYTGFPGDFTLSTAFGFTPRSGADGHGDGDGRIESCAANQSQQRIGCETALFWRDLYMAELITEPFNTAIDDLAVTAAGEQGNIFPRSKIRSDNFVTVFSDTSSGAILGAGFTNAFAIVPIMRTPGGFYLISNGTIPTEDAHAFDAKIDDGVANAGMVTAATNNTTLGILLAYPPGSSGCVDIAHQYLFDNISYSNEPLCHLIVRWK